MVTKGCFNVASLLFRQKSIKSRKTGKSGNSKKIEDPALQMQQRKVKRINTGCTYGPPDKSSLVMELRKKIMTLRYILDFPPCDGFASLNEVIIDTTAEVQKLFPEIIPISLLLEIKGASIDEGLVYFCKALNSVRELWMISHEWIDEAQFDTTFDDLNIKSEKLVEHVLATLDSIISMAMKKFDVVDEADEQDYSPQSSTSRSVLSESYSESNSSCCSTPITPTSVLPEPKKYSTRSPMRSPLLSPLRVQAVVKLNPIDLKRLSFHMFSHVENQGSDILNQTNQRVEQAMSQEENASKSIVVDETCNFNREKGMPGDLKSDLNIRPTELEENEVEALAMRLEITPTNLFAQAQDDLQPPTHLSKNVVPILPKQYEPESVVPSSVLVAVETPPSLPTLSSPMTLEALTSAPSPVLTSIPVISRTKKEVTPPPPPPPPPPASMIATSLQPTAFRCTPKAPPLPPPLPESKTAPPTPPPPPGTTKTLPIAPPPPPGAAAPPPPPLGGSSPPPPMPFKNGAAPPPPPPGGGTLSLRPGLSKTKLKRSSQLGNLYRLLKRKVEGTSPRVASSEKRTKVGGSTSTSGKQGMADALAEMTKRSAYFQQIEEDVQKYAKSIKELKVAISCFQTKDMSELLKFHKHVESVLEKLTDETQVLARFEDFPAKKLETLRTAASLYSRLDATITELHNWRIEAPLGKLLDKVEHYFNKIKVNLDAMERTKDEESKKFKNHNIHFDFGILVRIKEAIVDLSSGCMELALKERRESKQAEETAKSGKQNKGSATGLWRAFQLAFRVYTFAGGHDDRADQLTKELAREIETDPQDQ